MSAVDQVEATVEPRWIPKRPGRLVWWATGIFVVVYGIAMLWQYTHFAVHAFDFGIFDQGLWLLSRLEEPFVTVRGLHLFADHSSYIMFILVPLYWLLPFQEVMVVFTVMVVAAGGPLTYAIARRAGATTWLAAVAGLLFLLHPAVGWLAYDNFHPEVLVIPLGLGGFLAMQAERHLLGITLFGLALTAKEDVGLLIVPVGLYFALFAGKRLVGGVVALMGVGALALNFAAALPHFSPTGELLYSGRYGQLGEGILEVAIGVFTKPGVVWASISTPKSLVYLVSLIGPIPLAFLAPSALLAAIPAFLANVLSTHGYQAEIQWHYTTSIVVVLAIAAALGAGRLSGWSPRAARTIAWAALTLGLATQVTMAPNPITRPIWYVAPSAEARSMQRAVALIPEDAVVSAMDTFVPHLTHRRVVFEFPNPWQRHNYATPDATLPPPGMVEWVVVRLDLYDDMVPVIESIRASGEFEVVLEEPPVLLMRRIP
jgi:uncharacterized membrane protein